MSENEDTHAEVTFFIMLDDEGNFAVTDDEDEARERYTDNYNGTAVEMTEITLKMKKPVVRKREVALTLSDDATGGEVNLTLTEDK
jgi:hypothetical protein